MKCPNCGFENREGALYCGGCGTKLPEEVKEAVQPEEKKDDSALLELAEAFTGVKSAANEIVNASEHTISSVCSGSIAWIRKKDPDVLQVKLVPEKEGKTLDELKDVTANLVPLDYEERIAVLVHVIMKKTAAETASFIGTDEDTVKALLQNAYKMSYPDGDSAAKKETVKPVIDKDTVKKEEPKKKKPFIQKPVHKEKQENTAENKPAKKKRSLSVKIKVGIAVAAALIIGTFFGLRSYASDQYSQGIASMEKGDYESAVKQLKTADSLGKGGDTLLKLGEAYAENSDYTSAAETYEKYMNTVSDKDEVKEKLADTYDQLADDALDDKDKSTAKKYLQKEYDLNEDEITKIRLKAVSSDDGTYTDKSDGAVYDSYGNPTELYGGSVDDPMYTVDITYDDDHHFSSMSEYVKKGAIATAFSDFSYKDSTDVSISWLPLENSQDVCDAVIEKRDSNGNVIQRKRTTSEGTVTEKIRYTYDDKDRIATAVHTFDDGTDTVTDTYKYSGDTLKSMSREEGSSTFVYSYTYDKKGNLTNTVINKDSKQTGSLKYTYDKSGNLTDISETHTALSYEDTDPFAEDRHISYTYSASGTPMTMEIQAGDDEAAAKGYYVEGSGWVILYSTYITQ